MTINVPAAYLPVGLPELLATVPIQEDDQILNLVENLNFLYAKTSPIHVCEVYRQDNVEGITTTSTSSTNWILEYAYQGDPDISQINFSALLLTSNASYAANLVVQSLDNGSTASTTINTTATNYTWVSGTLTRAAFDSAFSRLALSLYSAGGSASAVLKAFICYTAPLSAITAKAKSSDFIPLDSDQAANGQPYPHTLIEHLLRGAQAIRRYRRWNLIATAEDAAESSPIWTTTSTSWAIVARRIFRLSPDELNTRWHVDGYANAASTSKVRLLVRPLGHLGTDPDTDPLVWAVPNSTGTTLTKGALSWGSATAWALADSAWTAPTHGYWEVLVQLISDGTYHPILKSLSMHADPPSLDLPLYRSWRHPTRALDLAYVSAELDRLYGGSPRFFGLSEAGFLESKDLNSSSDYTGIRGFWGRVLLSPRSDRVHVWCLANGLGSITWTIGGVYTSARAINFPGYLGEDGTSRNHSGDQAAWFRTEFPINLGSWDGLLKDITATITDTGSGEKGRVHVWATALEEVPLDVSGSI